MFGICNLAIVPMRSEPADSSEMISQLLFGEHFKIIEQLPKWTKIISQFDSYEGWICNKQFQEISEKDYLKLNKDSKVYSNDLIEFISNKKNELIHIPLGSSIQFLNYESINTSGFSFDGLKISGKKKQKKSCKNSIIIFKFTLFMGWKNSFWH